jgi:TfoX/Sxy family transcriptional regulator of competence genes
MATHRETIEHILESLGDPKIFTTRAMFGEYALYAVGKVVALVCNDLLYVKVLPASVALESLCETDAPYPGAKPHYVVAEDQLTSIEDLPAILIAVAESLPVPKKKHSANKKRKKIM